MMQEWLGDARFKGLVFVVLALGAVALGAYTYLAYTQAQQIAGDMSTISVTGTSEMFVRPDIASFSFSVLAEEKDAPTAQDMSAKAINTITEYLKGESVEEKDIKTTDYSLSPKYEYSQAPCTQWGGCPPGIQKLVGYMVTQTVTVKVRALEKAGDLISGVGGKGATDVSSIIFTVDDIEKAKAEVREKAIIDAKEKARRLAKSLDVRLGALVASYEESPLQPMYGGYGGEMMAIKSADVRVSPEITPGENKITATVSLVYRIR